MISIKLPTTAGKLEAYRLSGTPLAATKGPKRFNRVAFAAAHIVVDPLKGGDPSGAPIIDWDKTLAFRHHLLDLGFGIAEAMDTAQRGMGLDWPGAHELIRQSLASAKDRKDAQIFSGCGTEQLDAAQARHPDSATLAAPRALAYAKLMEKYQEFNPFKLFVYSAQAGQAVPQVTDGSPAPSAMTRPHASRVQELDRVVQSRPY